MYSTILVPVDLEHPPEQEKALRTAAELAKLYGTSLHLVTVSATTPNEVAGKPEQFDVELNLFAREHGDRLGVEMSGLHLTSVDPAVELDAKLLAAITESKADLVVMASHKPGVADRLHLQGSVAAALVRHSDVSVFVVR